MIKLNDNDELLNKKHKDIIKYLKDMPVSKDDIRKLSNKLDIIIELLKNNDNNSK